MKMESLIKNFERKENDWALNLDRYENFIQVAEKFGYEFNTHKTTSEVQKYLKDKIRSSLLGSDISQNEFDKIEDHLTFKYYSSNGAECKDAFSFIGSLRYVINRVDSYTNSIDAWSSVKDYLEAFLAISNHSADAYTDLFNEKKVISESIKFLRKKGYRVTIEAGEIRLSKEDEKRLLTAIEYRFNKLGHNSLFFTLSCISRFYDRKSKRFFLRSEPSMTSSYEADTPWGYLFNVSLSNLHHVKKSRNHKKLFLECIELAKHYFCIQRLQDFNKFSDTNHRYDTILPAIQKNILYDQHFSIDQISDSHMINIISDMFSSQKLVALGVDISLYKNILEWVSCHSRHDQPLAFSVIDIFNGLNCKYLLQDVESTLKLLSFQASEINKGYLLPEEIHKRNYYQKPFIYLDGKYVYINSSICNYGFYTSALNLCKSKGADGNLMGKVAEEFIERQFACGGVTFHANKQYDISPEIRKKLNIQSKERECDYIIETDDTIIFIELKRKTLTSEARSGNTLQSTIDLSQSLLHALSQTGCHEYMLRRDGVINFDDGSKLELLGRNVERIALSLFGFFGIQDGVFVHQLLGSLINAKIDSGDEKEDKKINKYLQELSDQYKTSVFSEVYTDQNNPFFNCRFFSVPQLLEILSNSTNNEEFKVELNRTRHVSTGCKDWFKDYQFIRSLQA